MADTTDTQALSNAELYLQSVISGESDGLPTPRSREEQFLKHCVERCGCDGLPTPRSRREKYLYALAETMAGGGSGETENVFAEYIQGTKPNLTAEDLAGATSIVDNCFYSQYIASIEIPDSVTSIGAFAFFRCGNLTEFKIPDSVETLGNRIFCESAIKSITIGAGVTTWGTYVCYNCQSLTKAAVYSARVGNHAFSADRSLTEVTLGEGVTVIEYGAFRECNALMEVICLAETPPTITDAIALSGVPADCIFKVKPASVEAYKAETNWSVRADNIVALTDEEVAQYGG